MCERCLRETREEKAKNHGVNGDGGVVVNDVE
jgi:hypothetical protein